MMMKIAFATDDGNTIHQHFGRATHYAVVTIEDALVVQRELRQKPSHHHTAGAHSHAANIQVGHGLDPESQARHGQMADAIADCEAILCGGMGIGAYKSMEARGIRPIITDFQTIEDAVQAYIQKTIINHTEKLH